MGRFQRLRGDALEFVAKAQSRSTLQTLKDIAAKVATPKRLEKHVDGATRTGQILSVLFLGPIIVVSLVLIRVLNNILSDIFGTAAYGDAQTGIIGWLITAITGGAFLLAAYAWFQFVRTAGFGWFSFDD